MSDGAGRTVLAKARPQCVGDLADGSERFDGVQDRGNQVRAGSSRPPERPERVGYGAAVPLAAQLGEARPLLAFHRIIDGEDADWSRIARLETVATDDYGFTPLMYAARQGNMDAAHALLDGGANINAVNGDRSTALLLAAINAHFDVAKFLVEHGVGAPRGAGALAPVP